MIEESLLKSNYLGKDGFVWWLGQVAPPEVWDSNDKISIDFTSHQQAWAYRCKVRIIGYHTYDKNELADNDLPWAHVMVSPSDGNAQGGLGKTHKLIGGETVFGFFLDGDDAQQPVVIGSIYRNANVPSFDVDEVAFKPFSGHTKGSRVVQGPTKQVAKSNTIQATPTSSGGNIIGGDMLNPTSVGIGTTNNQSKDKFFPCDIALAKAYAVAEREEIISENGCDDNVIGKITRAIKNFIAVVSGLESYLGTYIDPVLNTFVDITQEIKRTATIITGSLKFLINNMRNIIMKMVGCLFSKFVGIVIPIPQQPIVGEATKNILNIIFCLFEKIIDQVLDFLLDMLQGLVGRTINAPLCAIEEFVATLLNKVIDVIDELLAPVLSGLDWLMNGVSQVSSILSKATSIATQIFNLIGCDNLKCKTPSTWALNVGPSQADKDEWNKVVGKMNVIRGFNDDLATSVNSLSLYGIGSGAGIFKDCADRVLNPISQSDIVNTGNIRETCIPPEVLIYGDGFGAKAIAVVGDNGSILSIEVINKGFGYSVAPAISIIDNTNNGSGAKAQSIIEDGKVSQIYITSSGSGYCETNLDGLGAIPCYLVVADKYSFYEGDTCTFTIMTENITDGTDLKYSIGGEVSPQDIDGPTKGTITIFNSRAYVSVKVFRDDNNELVEELIFDVLDLNDNIVARTKVLVNNTSSLLVPVSPQEIPNDMCISSLFPSLPSGIGTITSGILTSVVITNPGLGYTNGDTISIGDCVINPEVSNNGSIVGVSSIFCPIEFTSIPTTFIDSNNGEGAVVYPVIQYIPSGNVSTGVVVNELGIIKVVDCV